MRALPALLALTVFSSAAVAAEAPSAGQTTATAAADSQLPHQGKVLSSIDAGIYTYLEVSAEGKTLWLAAPAMAAKKDDLVDYDDGPVITGFVSKSLGRTFETVMFVAKAVVVKQMEWPMFV